MKERRSRTSRAFRTSIPTLLVCAAILAAATVALFFDTRPQESPKVWTEFVPIAPALAALGIAIRAVMLTRRGKGRLPHPVRDAAADTPAA